MKVIWKRPDGFHQARPEDYHVVEVGNETRLWLHKSDRENFPFRVSGGWQDEDATRRLNVMVNLLGDSEQQWGEKLRAFYNHSAAETPEDFLKETLHWLEDLSKSLKGDTWEMDIMSSTFSELLQKLRRNNSELCQFLR